MTSLPARLSALTLFVEDLPAAREFYRTVFTLSPVFEDADSAVFRFGDTLINLLRATAAAELVDPAPVAGADAGARAVMTVDVPDVDAACATLGACGGALLNGPVNRPWGVRTASFRDPAGHVWELAAPIRAPT